MQKYDGLGPASASDNNLNVPAFGLRSKTNKPFSPALLNFEANNRVFRLWHEVINIIIKIIAQIILMLFFIIKLY
jgi:hypothetical protein